MCRFRSNRASGSILIILLWMLLAMSILCISFAKSVRVEANAAANTRQLTSAYYLAHVAQMAVLVALAAMLSSVFGALPLSVMAARRV